MNISNIPKRWSELTWQQLCDMWAVKMRYGGNADVARAAALLMLCGLKSDVITGSRNNDITKGCYDKNTGERLYQLIDKNVGQLMTTARELAYMAKEAMPWFDWPYGDPGEPAERDKKGRVIKERRDGVRGYVSPMQDAMMLPKDKLKVRWSWHSIPCYFKLPDPACMNITWQQYRTLQNIMPDLFREGVAAEEQLALQAKFLAHLLVPRSLAILDTSGGSVKVRPHWVYEYNAERAVQLETWFQRQLTTLNSQLSTLFHICFQMFQTALTYYAVEFPYLFSSGKNGVHGSAVANEASTLSAVMKHQGFTSPQAVYDENVMIILSVLNSMAKDAEEIEKMNAKIKKKSGH